MVIIFALGMAIRFIYLPFAGRIKGTVQINIVSKVNPPQKLSIKARLISTKSGLEFNNTGFDGSGLIRMQQGLNYEAICVFNRA